MELEAYRDPTRQFRVFKFTFSEFEYMEAKLDHHDRMLLQDCEAPDATIADKLLGLELIARRIEEAK